MVKILYDFDISKINNCRFYNPVTHDFDTLTPEFTSKLLKEYGYIYSYQYLSSGFNSVCFIESKLNSFYIVEPANGLIIAHDLIKSLIKFEEIEHQTFDVYHFCSLLDETIFRSHRNDDEFNIIGKVINYENKNLANVILKYPNSSYEWKYLDFVPELLRFGVRMMKLYTRLLPDFEEYRLYPELNSLLMENNALKEKYSNLMDIDNLGQSFLDDLKRSLKVIEK